MGAGEARSASHDGGHRRAAAPPPKLRGTRAGGFDEPCGNSSHGVAKEYPLRPQRLDDGDDLREAAASAPFAERVAHGAVEAARHKPRAG